jgi:hypothetical protein
MSWGSVEYDDFKEASKKLREALDGNKVDELMEDLMRDAAATLLELVIPLTPTGEKADFNQVIAGASGKELEKKAAAYNAAWGGYVGGTLKRGWTAGEDKDPEAFAQTLPVEKGGTVYSITVTNEDEKASYVEEGHRQTPGRYVPAIGRSLVRSATLGKHFLEKAELSMRGGAAEAKMQKRLDQFLEEIFG